MKYIYTALVSVIVTLGVINILQYHEMPQVQRDIYVMTRTCEQSAKLFDGKLEDECGELIDKVESEGFEVLSKNGDFWAESK